jgi:hypothetical protein
MLTRSIQSPNAKSRFNQTHKILSNPDSTRLSKEELEDWGSAIDKSEKDLE